jgi:hypothetical protein
MSTADRVVGLRLQIHESKYESVARFGIHAQWKRGFKLKYSPQYLFLRILYSTSRATGNVSSTQLVFFFFFFF